jgi:MarR family transcriptional regulator, lower aerobic nicotinate degradation pathway regulator
MGAWPDLPLGPAATGRGRDEWPDGPPGEVAPARLRTRTSWLINKTSVHSHRLIGEAFATFGGSGHHYGMLAALAEFGPSSQATLGRRLGFDRSDVAAMTSELVDGGLVERSQDPADRRRNIVIITDAGRARLERLDGAVADVQEELLGPLAADERAELVRLLGRVLDFHSRR